MPGIKTPYDIEDNPASDWGRAEHDARNAELIAVGYHTDCCFSLRVPPGGVDDPPERSNHTWGLPLLNAQRKLVTRHRRQENWENLLRHGDHLSLTPKWADDFDNGAGVFGGPIAGLSAEEWTYLVDNHDPDAIVPRDGVVEFMLSGEPNQRHLGDQAWDTSAMRSATTAKCSRADCDCQSRN